MPGPRKTLHVGAGYRRDRQPLGEATRGKTAPNRLRRLNLWLLRTERELLARRDRTPFVDLGYGRLPLTTLESARSLRQLNPRLPVLGVEVDPARVEAAKRWEDEDTRFRRGGFELPLGGRGDASQARVIRALNVLRQYEEPAARDAWRLLGDRLSPGGLLIEGTCSPLGRLMAVQLLRKGESGLEDAGLLFSTNFRTVEPLSPSAFQAVLPKHLIHHVVPGTAVHGLMQSWGRAWERARVVEAFGRRQVWVRAARELAAAGFSVWDDPWTLRRGFLLVHGVTQWEG
ncbi:MAG: class I SAM-dependent methyltransferase [Deltaproteobacteria bacterium]|nr:class I SAM-dependent methyltransferase [Deltaproteobacteria bacterium]